MKKKLLCITLLILSLAACDEMDDMLGKEKDKSNGGIINTLPSMVTADEAFSNINKSLNKIKTLQDPIAKYWAAGMGESMSIQDDSLRGELQDILNSLSNPKYNFYTKSTEYLNRANIEYSKINDPAKKEAATIELNNIAKEVADFENNVLPIIAEQQGIFENVKSQVEAFYLRNPQL